MTGEMYMYVGITAKIFRSPASVHIVSCHFVKLIAVFFAL